jgi:hypothetical protein
MQDEKSAMVLAGWMNAIRYGQRMIVAIDEKKDIENFHSANVRETFESMCQIAFGIQTAYDTQLSDELKKKVEEEFEKVALAIHQRSQSIIDKMLATADVESYEDSYGIKQWNLLSSTCARLYRTYAKELLYGIVKKQKICTREHVDDHDDDDRYSGCAEE